jgi:tetratricopeptide (TPR) repeat protein
MSIVNRHLRRAAAVAALLPLALAAGCMSAGKRYEQGLTLESRGRPAEAARRYADALRRDPNLPEARARLQETGRLAVDQYLAEARVAADAGRYAEAADGLLELDDLRRDVLVAGVELAVPADYAQYRREALDRAIDESIHDGIGLAESGRWTDALSRLDRIGRWQPSGEQRRYADEARLDTYSEWMGAEGAAGRHRAAFEVGERAVSALGRQFPGMERIIEAQQYAIDEGTLRVAVLPIGTNRNVGRALPASFLRDVEGDLEAGAWTRPPSFVEVMDPREVRREARRYDVSDYSNTSAAVRLGRAVGADLVVAVQIDSLVVGEADVRTERRAVRTREGADTAFTVRSGRRQAWAQVRYLLVDVGDGRVVSQERLTPDASRSFREAVYTGDWRQLLLSDDDRRLFNTDSRDDARGDLMRELGRAMTEELPRSLYDRVLREVR